MKENFTSVELFAGAGGLALGLEKAGFDHVMLNEIDKNAAKTLKHNRPEWFVINEDISKISDKNINEMLNLEAGELDLLSGGAPCQAFSYAGKRLGLQDTRGTLFYHFATFLEKLQPKMFLFENVKGLRTHDEGKTYKTMLAVFENMGYNIQNKVLNAWDYDVPQKRERLITIGIRKDLNVTFNFPEPSDYKPVTRDALKNVPKSAGSEYSEKKKELFNLVAPGCWWKHIDQTIAKEYMKGSWSNKGGSTGVLRRIAMDEPSLTILTTPSQKQTERCHPVETRPFTIRENARFQTFPDNWEFIGSISSQYRQIGNAVPVNLAYALGKEIIKTLKEGEEK